MADGNVGPGPRRGRGPAERSWPIAYAGVDDLRRSGRAERTRLARRVHADVVPAEVDAVTVLRGQEPLRIAELIPLRYARMLASPFTFYRGAAAVMAADLAGGPRTDLVVQLCGDAHLDNFGLFASPERRLVFDLNDFDETYPGPFEWDVKRLAASFEVALRTAGRPAAERSAVVRRAVFCYRDGMRRMAGRTSLQVWYAHLDVDALLGSRPKGATKAEYAAAGQVIAKARQRDHLQAVRKLTTVVDGRRRFRSEPPVLVPVRELLPQQDQEALTGWISTLIAQYARTLPPERRRLLQQYHLVEVARRVVGVGSVGTAAWVALFVGAQEDDTLVLQAKEAQPSVLAPYLPGLRIAHEGRRVVEGQRLMQAFGDPMLGWKEAVTISGTRRDYYLRQFRDWKGSFDSQVMTPRQLDLYAEACGRTLARAHARSGERVAIAAYLGGGDAFDEAIVEFARTYADKNEADYELLRSAAARGEITVAEQA